MGTRNFKVSELQIQSENDHASIIPTVLWTQKDRKNKISIYEVWAFMQWMRYR